MDPLSIALSIGVSFFCMYVGWKCTQTASMVQKIQELHDWHSVTDVDGVKVWYMKSTLEKAIGVLAGNVDKQTEVIQDLSENIKDQKRDAKDLRALTRDIKDLIVKDAS